MEKVAVNLFKIMGTVAVDTKQAENKLSGFEKKAKGGMKKAAGVIAKAGAAMGSAIAAVGTAALKAGDRAQESFRNISAQTGQTSEDMQKLDRSIRDLAMQTGRFTAQEMREALANTARAGQTLEHQNALLEASMRLAAATGDDLGVTMYALDAMMVKFGTEVEDVSKWTNTLAVGQQELGISQRSMLDGMQRAAGIAQSAGLEYDFLAASLSIAYQNGMSMQTASTGLTGVFQQMLVPTSNVRGAMERLGVQTVKNADGTTNAQESFLAFIRELENASPAMREQIMTQMNLSGSNLDLFTNLLNNQEALADLTDQFGYAQKAGDDYARVQEMANKRTGGFGEAIRRVRNFGRELLYGINDIIGSHFYAWVGKIVDGLGDFVQRLREGGDLHGHIQRVGDAFMGIVDAIVGIGKTIIPIIKSILPVLIDWFVVGVEWISRLFNWFKELWTSIADGSHAASDTLNMIWETVQQVFGFIFELISTLKAWFIDNFDVIRDTALTVLGAIWEGFKVAWDFILTVWEVAFPFFKELFGAIWETASNLATSLWNVFTEAWELIKVVWDLVAPYFAAVWDLIWAFLEPIIKIIWTSFRTAWELIKIVWNVVSSYFAAIWDTIAGIFSVVRNVLSGNFREAWEAIKGVLSTWVGFFAGIWRGIKGAFGNVAGWFRNVFQTAWEGVRNVFSTGGRIFAGIVDGISNVFTTVVNAIIRGINRVVAMPFNAINGVLDRIRSANFLGIQPFSGLGSINVPQIPELRHGGVLERGQVGLLEGDGAEAVVPLERNREWIGRVTDEFARQFTARALVNANDNQQDKLVDMFGSLISEIQLMRSELTSMQIVLDNGALVGQMGNKMDQRLQRLNTMRKRGVTTTR